MLQDEAEMISEQVGHFAMGEGAKERLQGRVAEVGIGGMNDVVGIVGIVDGDGEAEEMVAAAGGFG